MIVTPPAGSERVAAAARRLGVEKVWAVGGGHGAAAERAGLERVRPTVEALAGAGSLPQHAAAVRR